ncbi:MAG: dnaX, partial [Candidatus Brocadiaceae bacterium]|nr:dnaX [Candidatus Brocadiaceae bacterium]
VDTILNDGKTSGEFIDQLLSCVRDLLIFSSCGQDVTWTELNTTLVQRYGKSFSGDTLMYMVQILSDARMRTTDSLLQRILLEMAVIKLCRMESIGSLNEIADRIASLENSLIHLGGETTEKNKEFTPVQKPVTQHVVSEPPPEEYRTVKNEEKESDILPDEKNLWEKILLSIQNKKKSTWALLKEGRFAGIKDGEITIELPGNCLFHKGKLDQVEEKKLIEQCAKEAFQSNIRLKLTIAQNGNSEKSKINIVSGRGPSEQQVPDSICSEPAVKKTLELFGGHVVKVNK